MNKWAGKVALVTGASAGIGAAVTKSLVSHGMKVVGCGRNIREIQSLQESLKGEKGFLTAIRCDLRREEDILQMFETIRNDSNLGGVDVCINNAGLAHDAPLLSGRTEEWRDMLDVNVLAPTICTRETFKSMKERGIDDGHIIFISSMSAYRIVNESCTHFYAVTKHALRALIEGTRQEVREKKLHIRVTGISPGNVVTDFAGKMLKDEAKGREYFTTVKCLDVNDISQAVLYTLEAPNHVEVNDVLIRPTEQAS